MQSYGRASGGSFKPSPYPEGSSFSTNSPWTSPRLAPGPVAKPIRSPLFPRCFSSKRADVALTAALAAILKSGTCCLSLLLLWNQHPTHACHLLLKNKNTMEMIPMPPLIHLRNLTPAIDVVSRPFLHFDTPFLHYHRAPFFTSCSSPVIIPYPTAEQIAHPDATFRNWMDLSAIS
ncbi:hypothetical protein BC829DRAFT_99482 [Chytridium lagenaria]|nr:hypothetical protein BC829DRAFT_99482 [Chytridium lagenaria]